MAQQEREAERECERGRATNTETEQRVERHNSWGN